MGINVCLNNFFEFFAGTCKTSFNLDLKPWGKFVCFEYMRSKKHQCLKCKKSFYQKGHLNVHIPTIHEGNKDYKCDSCGKSFTEVGEHLNMQFIKVGKTTGILILSKS